ncbi:MAG: formylglycine-generating enzyme family protein [Bacteroidales bacterium]|nr:formylglycine-generating enzyme family protein [Bacteroidales bacterium]
MYITKILFFILAIYLFNQTISAQTNYTEAALDAGIEMVFVTGIEYMMGSGMSEPGRHDDENLHKVKVNNFYIGKFEITQQQYKKIIGTNPSELSSCGDNCPVTNVSWTDAVAFCNKLSESAGLTSYYTISTTGVSYNTSANGYRLPTETEWELAARAGTKTPIYSGNVTQVSDNNWTELGSIAYYSGNSCATYAGAQDCSDKTDKQETCDLCGIQAVGKKTPNSFGLHDMLGNVWEWCNDYYGSYIPEQQGQEMTLESVSQVSNVLQENPMGPTIGKLRVRRGGSWKLGARNARCAKRSNRAESFQGSDVGFRIARNS